MRAKKFDRFRDFRNQYAEATGVPPEKQLWWGWTKRQNDTYRPSWLYNELEDGQFVCDLKDHTDHLRKKVWTTELNLYFMVGFRIPPIS